MDDEFELKFEKKVGLVGCGRKTMTTDAGIIRVRMSFFAGSISGSVDDVFYPVEVDWPEGEVKFDESGEIAQHLCFGEEERVNVLEKKMSKKEAARAMRASKKEEELALITAVVADDAVSLGGSSLGSKISANRGQKRLLLAPLGNAPIIPEDNDSVKLETDSQLANVGYGEDGLLLAPPELDDDDGKILTIPPNDVLVNHPVSLNYIAMQRILDRVQDEVESLKEVHSATLRSLHSKWHPALKKYFFLSKQIDDSRTIAAYKGFLKDRKKHLKKTEKAKGFFQEGLHKLEDDAMDSEDFDVVAIVRKEMEETRKRLKERHFWTLSEHRLYYLVKYSTLMVQYIISLVWGCMTYPFFVFLFCFGFVFSGDVDISNDAWNGEDLEASVASGCFPLMCTFGFPGYVLDIRTHLFGREGRENKHWIWSKVFRPRNFDEQLMNKLFEIEKDKQDIENTLQDAKDQEVDLEELKEEARGGVDKFAKNVTKNKELKGKK